MGRLRSAEVGALPWLAQATTVGPPPARVGVAEPAFRDARRRESGRVLGDTAAVPHVTSKPRSSTFARSRDDTRTLSSNEVTSSALGHVGFTWGRQGWHVGF